MNHPQWIKFIRRPFPSANSVLLTGGRPVLVDSGYGSDAAGLLSAGIASAGLSLVVNTHWHSDHVGGNHHLRGVAIAAARADGEAVNRRDPDACLADWLDQPVQDYQVDLPLDPGDTIDAGQAPWLVVATPGHTPHHLSFYQPDHQVLIVGDAVHADDVGWLNLPLDGPSAINAALATVERLSWLPVRLALPGHGPAITDPPAAFAEAYQRYQRMADDPSRAAWHAMKRIFVFALMIHSGLPLAEVDAYLISRRWLVDHATSVFGMSAADLARDLLAELRRTGAVRDEAGRLVATTPHTRPGSGWRTSPGYPVAWPPAT